MSRPPPPGQSAALACFMSFFCFSYNLLWNESWFLFLLFFLQQNEPKKPSHKGNWHGDDLQCCAATRRCREVDKFFCSWSTSTRTLCGIISAFDRDFRFTFVWIIGNLIFTIRGCTLDPRSANIFDAVIQYSRIRTHRSVTVACLWTFFGKWDTFGANNIVTGYTLAKAFEITRLCALLTIPTMFFVGTFTLLVQGFKDIGSRARWPLWISFVVTCGRTSLTNAGYSGSGPSTTTCASCSNNDVFFACGRGCCWCRACACACRSFWMGEKKNKLILVYIFA